MGNIIGTRTPQFHRTMGFARCWVSPLASLILFLCQNRQADLDYSTELFPSFDHITNDLSDRLLVSLCSETRLETDIDKLATLSDDCKYSFDAAKVTAIAERDGIDDEHWTKLLVILNEVCFLRYSTDKAFDLATYVPSAGQLKAWADDPRGLAAEFLGMAKRCQAFVDAQMERNAVLVALMMC